MNNVFTHKCTIVIFMGLSVYTYNNIILGGIALIIFLGFFSVFRFSVPVQLCTGWPSVFKSEK
jgi:hypothetical protein